MTDNTSNFYFNDDFDVDSRGASGIEPSIPIIDSYLIETVYPVNKEELITTATEAEADETVLDVLRNLPDDKYISEHHINEAILEQEDGDE